MLRSADVFPNVFGLMNRDSVNTASLVVVALNWCVKLARTTWAFTFADTGAG